ncbi:MAG: peptidoglycan-binding domain-containing protein [Methylococcaceae bacterium]|nr:peptidoglycan-binding domain-containing protein [Methylococcaceae bacterium]
MGRTLRTGDQGDDVRALQDVLNFHIRRLQPLAVDGKFGPLTQARVMEFQQANRLQVDGVVGNQTQGKLYENEVVPFSLAIVPKLSLNLPPIGLGDSRQPFGIHPPHLIPPLVLPGISPPFQPTPVTPGLLPIPIFTPFLLRPASLLQIPPLNSFGQILNLKLAAPVRNDPRDPALRSYQQIVQLLETLPSNFPFRTMIIGAVPNPVKKIGDLDFGFNWGIDPLFDLKKLMGPTEFTVGAKGNAKYMLRVVDQPGPGGLKLGLFAQGDFKGEFDYTSSKAISRPLLHLEGSILLGVGGQF